MRVIIDKYFYTLDKTLRQESKMCLTNENFQRRQCLCLCNDGYIPKQKKGFSLSNHQEYVMPVGIFKVHFGPEKKWSEV